MNDDELLRRDAVLWNQQQPAPPDLDAALRRVEDEEPRSRRGVLNLVAAASAVAAAAAVVVISASMGDRGTTTTTTTVRPAAAPQVVVSTRYVDVTVTLTARPAVPTLQAGASTSHVTTTDTELHTVDLVATTRAKPAFGHVRALVASLGMFVVIAGAWGIGRAQRRRSH